jgi:hypothetical protein
MGTKGYHLIKTSEKVPPALHESQTIPWRNLEFAKIRTSFDDHFGELRTFLTRVSFGQSATRI